MAEPRLMDDVRSLMRRLHYSIHTERSYCDWIARFVRFHRMRSRDELLSAGAAEVEVFLTHLAVDGKVAAATQNQAMNALVFLYKRVLERPLEGRIDAARASKERRVPVVLTRLPFALDRRFPNAPSEWRWQYVFPAAARAVDPRSESGQVRRHHLDQSVINKAIEWAVKPLGIDQLFRPSL